MITRALDKYKLSTTKQAVTSYAGLPLLLGMAKSLGLEETLNRLPVKERDRGYKPAETIFCKPRSETVPNPPVEECTGEGRAVVTV